MPAEPVVAFAFTLAAGLATGIGSAIAFFIRRPKAVYLAFSLGLSAGAMLYVAFMELLPTALGDLEGRWAITAFFLGVGLTALTDILIPEMENPHHYKEPSDALAPGSDVRLRRTALVIGLALAVHNLPEGIAVFGAALSDLRLGAMTALIIGLHNVPEGITLSVPIWYATGSRGKAFGYSFLSGLAEPVGALAAFVAFRTFWNETLLALLVALIAGIMVYISLDELLPTAHRYGHGHAAILGTVTGMGLAAGSLLLF